MATNDDHVEKNVVPPVRSPAGEIPRPRSTTGPSAIMDGALKGASMGAIVLGIIGVMVGLVIAIVSAIARGPITDWAIIAAFGLIVTALAGGIYGALAGAVAGGLVGAVLGIVKSEK